jgi:hypothetical protein
MKKFSDKYLNNWKILDNAIVGFEFEFYCEKSFYKLLEYLNNSLKPIQVKGFRQYHSPFKPTPYMFKIEPDYSMGSKGIELITGPLKYFNAKIILLKILNILQEHCKTDERCSIHINISFDKEKTNKVLDYLNPLKLLLNVDEDKVYKLFPERKNNFYAKSVKRLIPFKNFNYSSYAINILKENLELPDTKYYGINIKNSYSGRLEYRYIGGKDYQFKSYEITELMDYFILLTWNSIKTELDDNDKKTLDDYLQLNISNYKNFINLDNFIAEFPLIRLQVDKNDDYGMLKTFYDKLYDKLYEVIINIYNLGNCIINYDTLNQRIEIVNAEFKTIFDLKDIRLINCNIDGGSFNNCEIIDSEIKNAHFNNTLFFNSIIHESKIQTCKTDCLTILNKCYVDNTFLDGKMTGGVFRSGKIGERGLLDQNVKIAATAVNYFGKSTTTDDKKDKKDKTIFDFENDNSVDDKHRWYTGYNSENNN